MFEPVFELMGSCSAQDREFVLQDLDRWMRDHPQAGSGRDEAFRRLFTTRQEFRSLVAYRMRMLGRATKSDLANRLQRLIGQHSWAFVTNLFLSCEDIGPGLYIEHGFSTIVFARRIGRNFRVNQNVTVGTGRGGHPTIGDDVSIYTGAVVIGGIRIGDNVRIGAGAVVTEDIPDGATVVPPKARIILRSRAGAEVPAG